MKCRHTLTLLAVQFEWKILTLTSYSVMIIVHWPRDGSWHAVILSVQSYCAFWSQLAGCFTFPTLDKFDWTHARCKQTQCANTDMDFRGLTYPSPPLPNIKRSNSCISTNAPRKYLVLSFDGWVWEAGRLEIKNISNFNGGRGLGMRNILIVGGRDAWGYEHI